MHRGLGVDDLTVVIGLRAHAGNPWVVDRIGLWADWYRPAPRLLLVDLGSAAPFDQTIRDAAERVGAEVLRVEDEGVYSQAIARNLGFATVQTPLVFFTDIDCLAPRGFFHSLLAHADALGLDRCFDQVVSLPAYFLDSETSGSIERETDVERRERRLARAFVDGVHAPKGDTVEFVDPFSNIFLCHRDFFSLTGGYEPAFRGRGSEDFEWMIRANLHSGHIPMPLHPMTDTGSANSPSFWGVRPWAGFRRLGEATALQAELAGLRVAHLSHPRSRAQVWYAENDDRRERFDAIVGDDLRGWVALLGRDGLPRERVLAAYVREPWEASLLMPLRLDGVRVVPVTRLDALDSAVADADGLIFVEGNHAGALEAIAAAASRIVRVRPGAGPGEWIYDGLSSAPSRFVGDRRAGFRVVDYAGLRKVSVERAKVRRPLDPASYAAARLGVAVRDGGGADVLLPERVRVSDEVRAEPRPKRALRKVRKLLREPGAFFADSRVPVLGRWFRRRGQRAEK